MNGVPESYRLQHVSGFRPPDFRFFSKREFRVWRLRILILEMRNFSASVQWSCHKIWRVATLPFSFRSKHPALARSKTQQQKPEVKIACRKKL